mgnify:CR=1 FL=1
MGYGFPVTEPMYIPDSPAYSVYSTGPAEEKELPDIVDKDLAGFKLQGTLAKALPKMAKVDTGSTVRAEETALEQYATKQAFGITKYYNARSKAIARMKEQAASASARRASKPRTGRAYAKSNYDKRVERNSAYKAAQALRGPSAFKYMTHIR